MDNKKPTASHPLRQERELRGWSRSYVAEQLKVDPMTVGRWERGERFPQPHYRQKLCELFEKNAQELGLFPEASNVAGEQDIASASSFQVSGPPHQEVPTSSLQASDYPDLLSQTPDPSLKRVSGNKPDRDAFSPFRHHRRLLLTGLVSLGVTALAGSVWGITHHSSPRPTPQLSVPKKPLYQLIDPNTHNWINRLAYSPDESMLAVAGGSNVSSVWNLQERTVAYYYSTLNQWINDVSWSKGNFLAVANASFSGGSIEIWHFPEPKPAFTLQRPDGMRAVSWSPQGDYVAFAGGGTTVEVWNPFTARSVNHFTYANPDLLGINRVRWSFDARYLASADDSSTVHVWEVATGKLVTNYHGHQKRVMDIAWCPGTYRIASASTDHTAQVWDALSGRKIITYSGHKDEIHGIDWSPNGKYLASGSYDATVQIWGALTGQHLATYGWPGAHVLTVIWSADGKFLALGSQEQGIAVWQAPQ